MIQMVISNRRGSIRICQDISGYSEDADIFRVPSLCIGSAQYVQTPNHEHPSNEDNTHRAPQLRIASAV